MTLPDTFDMAINGTATYDCKLRADAQALPFDIQDVRDQVPYNHKPDGSATLLARGGWWQRIPSQINGIAVHHMMTNNWLATAQWTARSKADGGKGYPSIQYHFCVQSDGAILYLLDVREGCWHDHAGDKNTHISVGMAGRLDIAPPPDVQLSAAAWLCAYLCDIYPIDPENVKGHNDWAMQVSQVSTVCPGWDKSNWRDDFMTKFKAALK